MSDQAIEQAVEKMREKAVRMSQRLVSCCCFAVFAECGVRSSTATSISFLLETKKTTVDGGSPARSKLTKVSREERVVFPTRDKEYSLSRVSPARLKLTKVSNRERESFLWKEK